MKAARSVFNLAEKGQSGLVVTNESSLSINLPKIVLVDYAHKAVDEAKERIQSAFAGLQPQPAPQTKYD